MLFKAYNLNIESDIDLGLPTAKDQTPDFYVKDKKITTSNGVKTNVFRKGIQAKISFSKQHIMLNWPSIGKFEAINGDVLNFQKLTHDEDVFRLFIISEALGLILQQRGYFLLHGSAVMLGKKATVFIGVPGAGKSTTIAAFAKAGYTILSDDMTAITFDETGKAVVLPAYPQIKIWEDTVTNLGFDKSTLEPAFEGHQKYILRQSDELFPSAAIPLEQIIVLQKPYSRKKKDLKSTEIPIELIKYYPLPQQILRGEYLERHFNDSIKIASQVSVKRINRPRNYALLEDFIKSFQ